MLIRSGKTIKEKSSRIGVKPIGARRLRCVKNHIKGANLIQLISPTPPTIKQTNTNKGVNMSWLIYKAEVVATYTFIYAQKLWGLLPF